MLNINFEFFKTDEDEYGKKYTWTYERDRYDHAEKFFSVYENYDKTIEFAYQTSKKEEYLQFKKVIKENGLDFKKTESIDGALVEFFENSEYSARLWSFTQKGNKSITYELTLLKKVFR
ncbi:hypothetical protein AB9K26_13485 [Psychroserpens sp. XS_ASV72]|uniref:hypothetical protein n=1 Tax=Psychroserpens sp. XS_ASV72 TaxID=3241293 RepID=UPI003512298E